MCAMSGVCVAERMAVGTAIGKCFLNFWMYLSVSGSQPQSEVVGGSAHDLSGFRSSFSPRFGGECHQMPTS